MLSYQFSIKTLLPGIFRNKYSRSVNESHLRGQIFLKNSWQVTVHMVRFTKLILYAYLSLDINSIICNGLFESWLLTKMYLKSLVTDSKLCYQQIYIKQRLKCANGGILRTMGHPKKRKFYGNGDSVKELGFRRFSSVAYINVYSCVGLTELIKINKNNCNFINDNLIYLVSDIKILTLSCEILKSNLKKSISSIDSNSLDKIDLDWLSEASKKLKAGKYEFSPVNFPLGKKDERPLINTSFKDEVIRQAMFFILNAIYEPSFLDLSHSFRPNKSAHTALKDIKFKFQDVNWCIEADIKNSFSNIDHKILLNILRKRIVCSKFLSLIKKSIKTGYIENKKIVVYNNKGLLQINIISSILNNIYLHQLDLFMFNLMRFFNCDNNHRKPLAGFLRVCDQTQKLKIRDLFDSNFKLYYTRYANYFVVGVVGSRKNTIEILEKIDTFLRDELKIVCSSEKTLITKFSKNPIYFLGTFIKRNLKEKKNSAFMKTRSISRVIFKAPVKLILKKAVFYGFFKKSHDKFVPTCSKKCINLNHRDILHYYNSFIRSILNYYSFVSNRKSLSSVIYGLKLSCARTLALKYKLRYASKVYKKFGSKLKFPGSSDELFIPSTFKSIKKFSNNEAIFDDNVFY